ncbi:flagellar hook-basal body complex protein FliE [Chthonobacter rhizosphaerae]|uniref:flagellar hook-basal body complex protein FliE n=1 Tax=Chthonobacter rhizosphaerae TaxID=2735553 RepID=UPI0015EF8CDA|nr:flagellar hook-basal body complex protein FliE [Chthonobacter rhizosphaerae]
MIDNVFKVLRGVAGIGAAQRPDLAAPVSPGPSSASFGDVFREVASEAYDKLKTAEATSIAGLAGKASAQEVTEATLAAELTLQTAVSVRDRAVAAYQEISRMPI